MSFLENRTRQRFVVVGDTVTGTTQIDLAGKMSARSGLERERQNVAHVGCNMMDILSATLEVAAPGAATTLPVESGRRQNVADQTR